MDSRPPHGEDHEAALTRKRVLYAEDDLLNRRLFAILLHRSGVVCDCVSEGKGALRLFAERRYDGVVLDSYMPGLDGREVARAIRTIAPKVPIIALTSDLEAEEDLLRAGFDRVFCKPLRGRECLDYLLAAIEARR